MFADSTELIEDRRGSVLVKSGKTIERQLSEAYVSLLRAMAAFDPGQVFAPVLFLLLVAGTIRNAGANVRANTVAGGGAEAGVQAETTIAHIRYDDPADAPDLGIQDVILTAWNDLNHPAGTVSVGYGRSLAGAAFVHAPGCRAPAANVGLACINNAQCDAPAGAGNGVCGTLVLPPPPGGAGNGDPVLAVDYHAGLDGALRNPRVYMVEIGTVGGAQGIHLFQSDDGGRLFPAANSANVSAAAVPRCVAGNLNAGAACSPVGRGGGCDRLIAGDNRGFCAGVEDDKPWIAVDQSGAGVRPPDGNQYVCWTRFTTPAPPAAPQSQILFAQRSPGGVFSAPVAISPLLTSPSYVQGCQVAVDIAGHVYVAWAEFLGARGIPRIDVSHANPPAGGAALAFGNPSVAVVLRRTPPGVEGCAAPNWLFSTDPIGNSFPSLTTDAFNGEIDLAYSQWRGPGGGNGATRFDVFFKKASRPGGFLDWLLRGQVRVNGDGNTATDQWLPSITAYPPPVNPRPIGVPSTDLKIQWYDKRASGAANDMFEIWSATSGGGRLWPNVRVSNGGAEPLVVNPRCVAADLNAGAVCGPPGRGGGCDRLAAGDNRGFCNDPLFCRPGDYNGLTSADLSVVGPDGNGIVPGSNFLHVWTDSRANAGTDPEIFYFTQPLAGAPGDYPLPSRRSGDAIVSLTAPSSVNATMGTPVTVPITASIANNGPDGAVLDTWYSVSTSSDIVVSLGAAAGDTCYGPKESTEEEPGAPEAPVVEVNCATAPGVEALGVEDKVANGQQLTHNRSLRIECQTPGTFSLTLAGGVAPVLPLSGGDDIVDDDLSDNSLSRTINVICASGISQFCNSGSITINDGFAPTPATPYPSSIAVAGQGTIVTLESVDLVHLFHTFPDDIDILLVGPTGANAIIMSDVGGGFDAPNVDLTLSDSAAAPLPDAGPLVSGTFKPTNVGAGDVWPAPAPAPAGASILSVFNGTNANGTWNLYVVDDENIDSGTIAGGWCLNLRTQCAAVAVVNDSLRVTKPAQGSQTANISVTDVPGPFNIYRGLRTSTTWSYNQTCFAANNPGSAVDPSPVPLAQTYFYLATRRSACGESIPGTDSNGNAIPNSSPCP